MLGVLHCAFPSASLFGNLSSGCWLCRVVGFRFVSGEIEIGNSSKPHLFQTGDSWTYGEYLGISMANLDGTWESLTGTRIFTGIPEARPGGRAEFGHGRFLLDPGVSAWIEHVLDVAENCSTPCRRRRIQPHPKHVQPRQNAQLEQKVATDSHRDLVSP